MTGRQSGRLALTLLAFFVVFVPGRSAPVDAQSVTIEGVVVGESGQPLRSVSVGADDPLLDAFRTEYFTSTRNDGTFQLSVPPALYVVTADPLLPRIRTSVRVDARGGSVGGLVLRVSTEPRSFVPDVPPRASLIQLSPPDASGHVTVSGAAGAVPANSSVFLITLDTGHVTLAPAQGDGSFSGSLFAPRGTSIQIKADPLGVSYADVFNNGLLAGGTGRLNSIPGTIVRVPEPPAAAPAVGFAGAGSTQFARQGESPLPAWTAEGTINAQALNQGDTLRIQGTLRIASTALAAAGIMQVGTRLTLERLSGPDGQGSLATNSYASVFVTPTGLPIERMPRNFNDALDKFAFVSIGKVATDRAEGTFDFALPIPPDLPSGYYRPLLIFNFQNVPAEFPPGEWVVTIDRAQRRPKNGVYLPAVRIGDPAPPRLYWTLLSDTLSNGSRGARAIEDRGRFGLASRILTQSETFIVPRLDPASGQPLTYRLEPFAPTVSVGDGVPPNPPLIPFRFPSGSLTVRLTRPDGSVQVLGPAPFAQDRMKTLVRADGFPLDGGGGHIQDLNELSTMSPQFEVQFAHDGRHVITLEGSIQDIWGNTWTGGGTYEAYVARWLSVDTGVLPSTSFEVGDRLTAGLVVSPPVPADVEVHVRLAPNSDPGRMVDRVIRGRANRFGYFHAPDAAILLDQPGEYRVDVIASFGDEQGVFWMGSRTWGGVVAPRPSGIVAHGRRGIDSQPSIGPQWFFRTDTGVPIGGSHVPFPFHSGDIMWAQKSDSTIPLVTVQDPFGSLANLLRARALSQNGQFNQIPAENPGSFDDRAAVGELQLFSSRPDRIDPHLDPSKVDLWAYSYRGVQRPLVRVREEISEERIPPPYWRFHEGYGRQLGVSERLSDLANDIKFQYGGGVLRGPALPHPEYAVYGSLFVLVPDNDPGGGSRTFPPFQGNGGGPSGGPIMTVKGRDIDLFIHLTGVRPGTVLEAGDIFALSGAVGPTLPALVSYTVTKPDGAQLAFDGRANLVGYYHRPEHNFAVDQPGVWTVDVRVTFDGVTSAGQVTAPAPTGDVLGTAAGRFAVYVVPRGGPALGVTAPRTAFLTPPAAFDVTAVLPGGAPIERAHVTVMMPGFVLDSRELAPGSSVTYRYDPATLAQGVPNLDVTLFNRPEAADLITISLFASGRRSDGSAIHAARVLALHGQELLNLPVDRSPASLFAAVLPSSRSVRVGAQATAFVTVINAGTSTATAVRLAAPSSLPATFTFQTTDPATNQVTGSPNTAVDIAPGRSQSFLIALVPTAVIAPTDVALVITGTNTGLVEPRVGINMLFLTAAANAVPDVVALAATAGHDGTVTIPGAGATGAFAVATVNVGGGGTIMAVADTGGALLPVAVALCATNPATGTCVGPLANGVSTQINAGATPTFSVFVTAQASVRFDPAAHRIFVRFIDPGGVVRGATSVAVRTP